MRQVCFSEAGLEMVPLAARAEGDSEPGVYPQAPHLRRALLLPVLTGESHDFSSQHK